jgi:predicted nucleic acid-binding protein
MARAQRKGHAANPVDALFAATALVYDLTLVTRNMRDFQPLEVALFNPWTSSVR